jgi:hypothetical protein
MKQPNYGRGRTGKTVTKTTNAINSAARIIITIRVKDKLCVDNSPAPQFKDI